MIKNLNDLCYCIHCKYISKICAGFACCFAELNPTTRVVLDNMLHLMTLFREAKQTPFIEHAIISAMCCNVFK